MIGCCEIDIVSTVFLPLRFTFIHESYSTHKFRHIAQSEYRIQLAPQCTYTMLKVVGQCEICGTNLVVELVLDMKLLLSLAALYCSLRYDIVEYVSV